MVGYGGAGVLTRALAGTRIGAKLESMPPQARKEFLGKVLAGTTGALVGAQLLRQYAQDRYLAKETQKTASFSSVDMVHYAYQTALERR